MLGLRWHCDEKPAPTAASVTIVYFDTKTGKKTSAVCFEGENLLHVAHKNSVDLEGACECSLACSTCHVVLAPAVYDRLTEPSDAEQDLLDLAFGLTATYVEIHCSRKTPSRSSIPTCHPVLSPRAVPL